MPSHYEEESHAHHLTFSCFQDRLLFKDRQLRDQFVAHLDTTRNRLQFKLFAYVVMPSHVHLLILPLETSISSILHSLKRPFAFRALTYFREQNPWLADQLHIKRKNKWTYRFWMAGGGYDRNIFSDTVFRNTMSYIHSNPVKDGLAGVEEAWEWSSARFWHTGDPVPISVDIPEWWQQAPHPIP